MRYPESAEGAGRRASVVRKAAGAQSRAATRLTLMLATMGVCTSATAQPANVYLGTQVSFKREVKLAVIAPADSRHEQSLPRVLPAVLLAVRAVSSPRGSLPGWNITVDHRDSRCSSTYGPLAAFDFYINRTAGHRSSSFFRSIDRSRPFCQGSTDLSSARLDPVDPFIAAPIVGIVYRPTFRPVRSTIVLSRIPLSNGGDRSRFDSSPNFDSVNRLV